MSNDPTLQPVVISLGTEEYALPPGERAAAGKAETATLVVGARHAGSSVIITVRDDGRGIDPADDAAESGGSTGRTIRVPVGEGRIRARTAAGTDEDLVRVPYGVHTTAGAAR